MVSHCILVGASGGGEAAAKSGGEACVMFASSVTVIQSSGRSRVAADKDSVGVQCMTSFTAHLGGVLYFRTRAISVTSGTK
jgi:hypothetical protein